ncbi:integrase domain-containing protein [Snodgrassella alvi]|uniref:integrase domain-containing protein n=1 Tax=Snodgrassella alvi TaxID=1196083 RepID=UPI003517E72E
MRSPIVNIKRYQRASYRDPALTATIEIARTFGLRGKEAVQSCQSLQTWKSKIEKGDNKIKVVFGMKGGRPRDTIILNQQRALNAENAGLNRRESILSKLNITIPSLHKFLLQKVLRQDSLLLILVKIYETKQYFCCYISQ